MTPHLAGVKQRLADDASAWNAAEHTREDTLRPIEQQLIAERVPPPHAGIPS
jgi:hypothetical protein